MQSGLDPVNADKYYLKYAIQLLISIIELKKGTIKMSSSISTQSPILPILHKEKPTIIDILLWRAANQADRQGYIFLKDGLSESTLMVVISKGGKDSAYTNLSQKSLQNGLVEELVDNELNNEENLELVSCGKAIVGMDVSIVNPDTTQEEKMNVIKQMGISAFHYPLKFQVSKGHFSPTFTLTASYHKSYFSAEDIEKLFAQYEELLNILVGMKQS